MWTTLGEIAESNIGLTYKPSDVSEIGIPVYRSNNIQDRKICLDNLVRVQSTILPKQYLNEGDLLICARNGSRNLVGKCALITELCEPTSFGAFMAVCRSIFNPWIYFVLNSNYFNQYLNDSNSTAINQVTQKMLLSFLIPLPPIKQQKRIVTEVENWISVIDGIEKGKDYIVELISQTKSKILNLAIHGKLVPQDPADEPASELLKRVNPNSEITSDNEQYGNIPQGWLLINLGFIFDAVSAKRIMKSDWKSEGVPFYRAREIVKLSEYGRVENELFIDSEYYTELKDKYGIPQCGDIMLSAVGTIGKCYIVRSNDKFYYKDASVLCLRNIHNLNSKYFSMLFSSSLLKNQMSENSKGTTVDTITLEKLKSYVIPLPPLAEQHRIVAKIEELFAQLEIIENSLQA